MASALLVNGGNYLYNLLLGRILGPEAFAEAALLVTLLLVVSFLGMTFQLASAKFVVLLEGGQWRAFLAIVNRWALLLGLLGSVGFVLFADELQQWLSTSSPSVYWLFGAGIPLYFLMSIRRGIFQGSGALGNLSLSYQTEMWSRLILTIALLLFLPVSPGMAVAIGIVVSFIFGFYPAGKDSFVLHSHSTLSSSNIKKVAGFMLLTAGYEMTQIIINNFDLILVKHFFDAQSAGLYASITLIGRVVYFATWMFAMLMLPSVVQRKKEGNPTAPVFFKYLIRVGVLTAAIVAVCLAFPEQIVLVMFGKSYLASSTLLWQYALATALFAISNIFAYYFLSIDRYWPVLISGCIGLMQCAVIFKVHHSLEIVVQIQICMMTCLLLMQLVYFVKQEVLNK